VICKIPGDPKPCGNMKKALIAVKMVLMTMVVGLIISEEEPEVLEMKMKNIVSTMTKKMKEIAE
jgi:hypothetical protein